MAIDFRDIVLKSNKITCTTMTVEKTLSKDIRILMGIIQASREKKMTD